MSEVCTGFRLLTYLVSGSRMGIQKEERSVGGLVEWLTDMHTCQRRADIDLLDLGSEFAINYHILPQHIQCTQLKQIHAALWSTRNSQS